MSDRMTLVFKFQGEDNISIPLTRKDLDSYISHFEKGKPLPVSGDKSGMWVNKNLVTYYYYVLEDGGPGPMR